MATRVDLSQLARSLKDSQVGFIQAELDAGMTFAFVAESGGNAKGQSRTCARAAYDSVLRFIDRVPLTVQESQKILSRLGALKKRLESLGETF